jgi:hypothetical protein
MIGIERISETRHRRWLDREHVKPETRVTALLKDGFSGILIGPLAEKFPRAASKVE